MRNVWKALLFVVLGVMVGPTSAIAGPVLSFETTDLNIGPVYVGEIVEASFKFVNASDQELVINKIDSSCGCLVPGDATRSYAPGERGEIAVKFDPGEAGTTGRIKKDIIVRSNDKNNPRVILSLDSFIYTVEGGVPYEPPTLNFRTTPVETKKTATVTIYGGPFGQTVIEKVIVPDGFSYSLESIADEDGVRRLIHVSNEPRYKIGRVADMLKIRTTNRTQPVLEIPLSLNVIGELSAEPSRLFFGHFKSGSKPAKIVRLSSSSNTFNILEATTDLEFIQINREEQTANKTHVIKTSIDIDVPLGRFDGTLTILTDNKYQPRIEIPIRGTVTE